MASSDSCSRDLITFVQYLYSYGQKGLVNNLYYRFVRRPTESGDLVDWCRPKQQRLVQGNSPSAP